MGKVQDCIERIRVIRGVNNGNITKEQLDSVFELQYLTVQERECVLEHLKETGVTPICEDEGYFEWKTTKFPQKENGQRSLRQFIIEQCAMNKAEAFARIVDEITTLLNNEPGLLKRYKQEAKLLREFLIEEGKESDNSPFKQVTNAIMKLSAYRVRNIRNEGWICGTYMSSVRETFVRKIRYYFTDQELTEFVKLFVGAKELDEKGRSIVLFLLHNVPKTLINGYRLFE